MNIKLYKLRFRLINLKKQVIDSKYKVKEGICCAYEDLYNFRLLSELVNYGIDWANWPKFSGDDTYPVPSFNNSFTPERMFHLTLYMFNPKTKYGQARLELLDWLIEQTDIKTKELP